MLGRQPRQVGDEFAAGTVFKAASEQVLGDRQSQLAESYGLGVQHRARRGVHKGIPSPHVERLSECLGGPAPVGVVASFVCTSFNRQGVDLIERHGKPVTARLRLDRHRVAEFLAQP